MPPATEITEKLQQVYTSIGSCTPEQARHYIHHIDDCTKPESHDPQLLGHRRECHVDKNACGSILLYLRRLAPHYPNIRQLVNMVYQVKRFDTQITAVDQELQLGDHLALETFNENSKHATKTFSLAYGNIDETKILEQFKLAFTAYYKRCLDLPEFPCILCTKLCFRRDCAMLENCTKPVDGLVWDNFFAVPGRESSSR